MGYAAGFPAGITGIELRPDSDDPNSADGANIPDTRRGRFRVAFPNGWVDGCQDGRAIVGYMIREPDLPAPPPPTVEPVPPRYHSQQDRTEDRL